MALVSKLLALLLSAGYAYPDGAALPFTVLPVATAGFHTEDSLYRVFRTADEFLVQGPRRENCDASCVRTILESVDFARNMVVVIAPRGRGQNTYDVALTGVTVSQGTIDVSFLELRHGPSLGELLCGIVQVMPTPLALVVIPQSDLPVRFFRSRADVICEAPEEVTGDTAPSN